MKTTSAFVVAVIISLVFGGIVGAAWGNKKPQEHTATHAEITTHVGPSSMDHTMNTMIDNLEGKTGDELDRAFLDEMIVHHEGAIDMAEMVKNSTRSELKNLAEDIIEAQTKEIEQMKIWRAEWFK